MSQADDVTYPDADLVALLRSGDEEAIAQLVERWSPTMLRLARSFVASSQSAEDVVQEAWLGMLSGLARFEGRSSLRTWTFTILVNRARTRGAREARTVPQPPLATRGKPSTDDWFPVPATNWRGPGLPSAIPPGGIPSRRTRRSPGKPCSSSTGRSRRSRPGSVRW